MSRRGRSKSDADSELILRLMIFFIAIPMLGIYWAFKGDTETKRLIGWIILIVVCVGAIFSMFS